MSSRLTMIAALTAITGSTASIANIVCPCEDPPMGTVMTKSETDLPGGGTFKLECTNESQYGNFETYYCTPDGDKHHIGTCIYIGGKNWFRYTTDPDTGEVCTITHYNMDNDDHDNDDHQLKVYIYDAKDGTTETRCYKKNDDCTYTEVGEPECRDASVSSPAQDLQGMPKNDPSVERSAEPQTWVSTDVGTSNRATGSREIVLYSEGFDTVFDAGDVLELGAPASSITSLHPAFEIAPERADGLTELVVTEDVVLNGEFALARIDSSMGRESVSIAMISTADTAYQTDIEAVRCTTETLDINEQMDIRLQMNGSIERAPLVADLDGDSVVGAADLAELLGCYGTDDAAGDVNGDGIVNMTDLATILSVWGMSDE